jgi:hypothetical protein
MRVILQAAVNDAKSAAAPVLCHVPAPTPPLARRGPPRVDNGGRRVSTLDRIGGGLTVFVGVADPSWATIVRQTGFSAPLNDVLIDSRAASALGNGPTGAVLVRPDRHEVARWRYPPMPPIPASPGCDNLYTAGSSARSTTGIGSPELPP